ncbi:TrbI/VirB10 family protein [bacterium]|nr:MAG: TrbI/VirB10 family protein [bacterium]
MSSPRKSTGRPSSSSCITMRWSKRAAALLAAILVGGGRALAQSPGAERLFRTREAPEPWKGVAQKTPLKANYFLPTGFSFPARLENAVYSYNVETPAIAVVERDISYLKRVVVPAETRVIGAVTVQKSHDRVLINFHTLVFPDGEEVRLPAIALSLDGSAGLKGKVETHKDSAVANTVLRSVVSGTQAALNITGISPIAAQAAQGVSQEALRELDMERQQVTTSITVDADTGLRVYVNQRLEY